MDGKSGRRNWHRTPSGVCGGFSLIELTIVLFILGIVLMMALPVLVSSLDDARIGAVGSQIGSALRFARDLSMMTARPCRATFDVNNETILLEQQEYKKIADILNPANTQITQTWVESAAEVQWVAMKYPMMPGRTYRVDYVNGSDFKGVNLVSATFGSGSVVTFDNLGRPSNGGTVVAKYGPRQATITVDSSTGRVTESW